MSRYLITGARGFIGKHLGEFIRRNEPGSDVVLAAREHDLSDAAQCARLFRETPLVDYVLHLADVSGNARWSAEHAGEQFFANTRMSLAALESWRAFQPQARFIGFSSLWAYPERVAHAAEEDYWDGPLHAPTEHYGINKKLLGIGIEACKRQYGMKGTVLVLGSVYGPGDRSDHVIPSLLQRMKENPRRLEVWGDGMDSRDFIFVEDQVRGILAHKDYDGSLLNISGGQVHTIRDVVAALVGITGYTGEVVYKAETAGGVRTRSMDMSRARERTGWPASFRLHTLEEGLSKTVRENI